MVQKANYLFIFFVQAAIKHVKSNNNRTGQQGTKVHLQLPSKLETMTQNTQNTHARTHTHTHVRKYKYNTIKNI